MRKSNAALHPVRERSAAGLGRPMATVHSGAGNLLAAAAPDDKALPSSPLPGSAPVCGDDSDHQSAWAGRKGANRRHHIEAV